MEISAKAIIAAFESLEGAHNSAWKDGGKPAEALRRFSVARGKLIYVCPRCNVRVRQFVDLCAKCGKRLLWDIRVVK